MYFRFEGFKNDTDRNLDGVLLVFKEPGIIV